MDRLIYLPWVIRPGRHIQRLRQRGAGDLAICLVGHRSRRHKPRLDEFNTTKRPAYSLNSLYKQKNMYLNLGQDLRSEESSNETPPHKFSRTATSEENTKFFEKLLRFERKTSFCSKHVQNFPMRLRAATGPYPLEGCNRPQTVCQKSRNRLPLCRRENRVLEDRLIIDSTSCPPASQWQSASSQLATRKQQ